MNDEIMLKQKYNDLLSSLKKGEEYVKANPDNEDYKKRLEEIGNEIQNIMKMFPKMTAEEMENGFVIEQVNEQAAAQVVQTTTTVPQTTQKMIVKTDNTLTQNFENNWEIAEKLCKSSIIPKEFQGKPENVLLCMGMSQKMGLDVITVMNNLQLVMGRQEWKGSFIPVLIEKTGKYNDLEFNFVGKEGSDDWGCYLEATRTRDGKRIKGTTITIKMTKDEGWYNRNSKWKTMPQQMLIYRASSFFARAYCAAALNGINTEGEINDINSQPKDILS